MQLNRRDVLKSLAAGLTVLGSGALSDLDNPYPNLDKIIDKAVDANIIVYDADAKSGEFTIRLVHLMKKLMRHNAEHLSDDVLDSNYIEPTDIYLPDAANIDPKYTSVAGMKIHIHNGLTARFKQTGGCLVGECSDSHDHVDKYAVLLVDKTGVGLLGSF